MADEHETSEAIRYGLNEEDARWQQRARHFAEDKVAPVARVLDRERRFSRELVRQLGQSGLIGACLPTEYGGAGASAMAGVLIAEEFGAVDGSIRGFHAVQSGLVLTPMVTHAPAALQSRWLDPLMQGEAIGAFALTEPEAGSDVGAMRTRVEPDGDDHVRITGEKVWITNGGVAHMLLVFASADPEARTRGIECYLVPADAEGLTRKAMPGNELGHRASDHAHLVFDGVRVPRINRIGGERRGFQVAMSGLGVGRLNVAAGAVGVLRACLEAATEHARTRRQFGQRIGDFQQVGAQLADMSVDLEAARLLVHQAARLRDRGLPAEIAVSRAKLFATERALEATQRALRLHGNRGYSDVLPIERHYRDIVALTIYEGTSEVQRVILSRDLLGRDEGPASGAKA